MNDGKSIVTYGDYSIDVAATPTASILALLSRGLSHVLGNEVSSKVGSHFRSLAVKQAEATKGSPLTKEEREAAEKGATWDTESDEYANVRKGFQEAKMAEIADGKLGMGTGGGGVRVDPFTSEVNAIVKREVIGILKAHKLHEGRKDPTDETEFRFSVGTPQEHVRSFASLKSGYLAKNEAKVHKEAKQVLDARARAKAKAEQEAAKLAGQPVDADAIGF